MIQDLIGEYNVEHRKQIKRVNEEYLKIIYTRCIICDLKFPKDIFCSGDFFINKKSNLTYYYCSTECLAMETNDKYKNKYITSIEHYLSTSLQYPGESFEF